MLKHLKKPKIDHCKSKETKFLKPPTAATRYITLYAASTAEDALIREAGTVHMILDRSLMWDCSPLKGNQSCYSFQNGSWAVSRHCRPAPPANILMQQYPCSSTTCRHYSSYCDEDAMECDNNALVGRDRAVHVMKMFGRKQQRLPSTTSTPSTTSSSIIGPLAKDTGAPRPEGEGVVDDCEGNDINEGQRIDVAPPAHQERVVDDTIIKVFDYFRNMFSLENFVNPA